MIFSLFTDIKSQRQRSNHTYFFTEFLEYMEESFAGAVTSWQPTYCLVWTRTRVPPNISLSWSWKVGSGSKEEISYIEESSKHKGWLPGVDIEDYERWDPLLNKLFFRPDEAKPGLEVLVPGTLRSPESGEICHQSYKSCREQNCPNNDSSPVWNLEISPPCRDVDQPCLWHGSSLERLGTLRGELFSSIARQNTVPIEILKGWCSCKKKCSDSWRCGCYTTTSHHTGMDALLLSYLL